MRSRGSVVEVVDELILEAILQGARAGVFRRAARLNPKAKVWHDLAEEHSRKVANLLDGTMERLGVGSAEP